MPHRLLSGSLLLGFAVTLFSYDGETYEESDSRFEIPSNSPEEVTVPSQDESVYLPRNPYPCEKNDFIEDSHGVLYLSLSDFSDGSGYLPPSEGGISREAELLPDQE